MANLFRNLFGHKKSHSKGDEENGNDQMTLERDTSRRSVRPPSSSSRSALRGARFQDDSMLPPTAAYHTQNQATRVRRGPKSCPPEYVDEEPASSRSFNVDSFRREPREQRRQRQQMMPSSSMMTSSTSSHRGVPQHYQQRWETSEYGSENTSPIGYHRHQQHHHHRRHQEEDDEEEDEETEEDTYKKSRYQELKRKIRAHYEERLFNYERAQRNDHRQIKELEKEKDDLVKMLLQSNAKLEKEKKKTEYFKRKWQEAEQQIKIQQPNSSFGQFGFQATPPQFPQMYQFGQSHSGQRYSFMGAPMPPISSSNTPTTSGMDTTTGGAGESLVPASDVSFMVPLASVSSALPPLDLSNNSGPSTSNAGAAHQQQSTSNFYPEDDDEDQDEIKNFREEDIEVPRGSTITLKNEDLIDSSEFLNGSYLGNLHEGKDSGFSTTPDDDKKVEKVTPVH